MQLKNYDQNKTVKKKKINYSRVRELWINNNILASYRSQSLEFNACA